VYTPRVSILRAHSPGISRQVPRPRPDVPFVHCESGSAYLPAGRSSTSPGCLLPARLHHARDLPGRGELAQSDPRELEFTIIPAWTAGQHASVANPGPRSVARQLGELELRREPLVRRRVAINRDGLQARAPCGGAFGQLLPPGIFLYRAFLRHVV